MSKIQLVGIVLLITGIIMQFTLENDTTDFIGTFLIGCGIGVLIGIVSKKSAK